MDKNSQDWQNAKEDVLSCEWIKTNKINIYKIQKEYLGDVMRNKIKMIQIQGKINGKEKEGQQLLGQTAFDTGVDAALLRPRAAKMNMS